MGKESYQRGEKESYFGEEETNSGTDHLEQDQNSMEDPGNYSSTAGKRKKKKAVEALQKANQFVPIEML